MITGDALVLIFSHRNRSENKNLLSPKQFKGIRIKLKRFSNFTMGHVSLNY